MTRAVATPRMSYERMLAKYVDTGHVTVATLTVTDLSECRHRH